ncbi:HDOD domain-containing protein [Leptospira ilyithenensis]|uniref:HDOD domain-containing protein n=1 Tax=Leptospira ilyithenensis TaxID=2484901 RepID=A0A4R9LSV7_9LEPT|nr:HDOD domain-containing protein [Leptospira ilyithenensis]TGN14543.1 HDOD domain-containing protein [Leptospira ilyithenensis]
MPLQPLISFQEEFLSGNPIRKEYIHFSEINCHDLDVWIGRISRTVSLEFLHEILFTILNELLVNACKANAKRVFFKERGLNIHLETDYSKGIPMFKDAFGHNRKSIFALLDHSSYQISLEAQNFPNFIEFKVRNNAKILNEEKNRIEIRVQSSSKYKNINDAYKESVDNEESSGLGIVLIHILLRNSGLKNQFFELITMDDYTEVIIRIPKLLIPLEQQNQIRSLLLKEVDGLPPLSPQIQKLIQLSKDKDVDWPKLAAEVQKEPAITAEVLKIANAAFFGGHTKVTLVVDALKRIGLKNIETIFLALGARKIMNSRYAKQKSVWAHSFKTSLYSRFLGQSVHDFVRYSEIAPICGLLHDLGRMVLLSLDLSIIQQIRVLRSDEANEISEWVEEFTLGITHSDIGYLIAKKWNFPEEVIDVIRYHHKPWQCKSSNLSICKMIYVSDILANTNRGKGNYYTIEPEILENFGIQSETEFRSLLERFKNKFEEHKDEFEELFN